MTNEEIGQEHERLYPDLVRFAALLVHDTHKAEDIVQEVFTRLFEYEGKENVKRKTFHTWMLKRITLYVKAHVWENNDHPAKDEHRSISLEAVLGTKEEWSMPEDIDPSSEALNAVWPSLKPKEQQILVLYMSGVSQAEIGKMMGIGEEAVRQRYHRALRTLRLALENVGISTHPSGDSRKPSTNRSVA